MNRKSAPGRWPSPGTHPARRANLCGGAGHLAQRTLDAVLRRQGVEMHRHGSDERDAVLVPSAGHRRRRPQRLERPGHQTGDLSAGRNHGAGPRPGPSFLGKWAFPPPEPETRRNPLPPSRASAYVWSSRHCSCHTTGATISEWSSTCWGISSASNCRGSTFNAPPP